MSNSILTPSHYQPFEKLVICGNTLINGNVPIAVDGYPVFLIGKGDPPRLWLNKPSQDKTWSPVVVDGISNDSNVRVLHNGKIVAIYINDQIILQATKENDCHLIISHINLKPFGLAITGDITSLKVGGNLIVGNIFEGVATMVNVK